MDQILAVLIDRRLTDWQSHPSCLSETLCTPSSLSILSLFKQEDYSKESSKASSEGIIKQQQRDYRGKLHLNRAMDPCGLCKRLMHWLESWLLGQLLPHSSARISQSFFFSRCLTGRVAKTSQLYPVSIHCSLGQWQSGQRQAQKGTKGIWTLVSIF